MARSILLIALLLTVRATLHPISCAFNAVCVSVSVAVFVCLLTRMRVCACIKCHAPFQQELVELDSCTKVVSDSLSILLAK